MPKDIWKLSRLTRLVASNNQITELPPNFEWLANLECLQISDNLLTRLPEKFGLLTNLNKLYLHENRLATLPRDLGKLNNLAELSLEWFMYTKPANSRIQKNHDVIKSVRDFCQNFQFNPMKAQSRMGMVGNKGVINTSQGIAQRALQMSICSENLAGKQDESKASRYVTFADFIVQYHKIPHSDMSLVNKIEFTMKKRSLIHQLCFNIHAHLVKSLLNLPSDDELVGSRGKKHQKMLGTEDPVRPGGGRDVAAQNSSQHAVTLGSNAEGSTGAGPEIAKVVNLNKKDTQGVVPLCLLVMNMTPVERPRAKERGDTNTKSSSNFFSQESNQWKAK